MPITHDRISLINAHFAWSLFFWGSAECSLQDRNLLPAMIGFYYSAFHAGYALAASDHRNPDDSLRRVRHAEVQAWVIAEKSRELTVAFLFLRKCRESFSYLGFPTGLDRLHVVRGAPTGIALRAKSFSFEESVQEGKAASEWFMNACWIRAADRLKKDPAGARLPVRGSQDWLTEYLGEDALISVTSDPGRRVARSAFRPLIADAPPSCPSWMSDAAIWFELTNSTDQEPSKLQEGSSMPVGISAVQVQEALRAAAVSALLKPDTDWTMTVLRALAGLAPGKCVDPDVIAPRRGRGRIAGEHMWDLCISDWPSYQKQTYGYPDYFAAAITPKLLLVAECEWGKGNNRRENGLQVLEDFNKILHARAPIKVMVFSYFVSDGDESWSPTAATSSFKELTGHMERLIGASEDDAEYVLFGVAWDASQYSEVIATRSGVSPIFVGPEK